MNHIFTVEGMTCAHCEKAITQAVLVLDAQAKIEIDRPRNQVQVDSSSRREALAQAIAEEGYRVLG
jgi:copper chaperone